MFWISVRNVMQGEFVDEPGAIGTTRYISCPDEKDPTPKDAIPRTKWVQAVLDNFPPDPAKDNKRSGDIVFFVHGYNNTVKAVAARQRLLMKGLRSNSFPCVVISFDWPSGDTPLGYLEDRHDAKQTAMRLVQDAIRLLLNARNDKCDVNVHVVAHSMGAYLVREAFDDADDSRIAAENWTANQVVFVAGDVSSRSLETGNSSSESLYRHTNRLTNYFSHKDEPLQASNLKRAGLSSRVGRVGLPAETPSLALDVDCTERYEAISVNGPPLTIGSPSHSWYFHDTHWMADLAYTLAGKIDRNAIPTRKKASSLENDFVLKT